MTQRDKLDGLEKGQERQRPTGRPKPGRITVPCSACDQPATISFEPKAGEPVYCNECFQPQPKNIRLDARSPLFPMKSSRNGTQGRGGWGGRQDGGARRQQRGRR